MDFLRRRSEAALLQKTFGDSFLMPSKNEWRFEHRDSGGEVVAALTCYLPEDYPSISSSTLVLESPLGVRIPQKPLAPGKEVGLSLGRQFFAFCEKNISGSTASSGAAASAGATPQQPTEDDATEDLINLGFNMARHLSAALLHDRWQNHGQGIFVHGASGMLVQIKDKSSGKGVDLGSIITHASQSLSPTSAYNLMKSVAGLCLHIKVDGVDADGNRRITAWAREQIAASLLPGARTPNRFTLGPKLIEFAIGPKLIKFAEAQRAAAEAQYGPADGIADRPTA